MIYSSMADILAFSLASPFSLGVLILDGRDYPAGDVGIF